MIRACVQITVLLSLSLIANWLNPDKSLREQGVEDTVVLTLRTKYSFSDTSADENDPLHLNHLYIQAS